MYQRDWASRNDIVVSTGSTFDTDQGQYIVSVCVKLPLSLHFLGSLRAMQWLVMDARPNDSLFFHYMFGHLKLDQMAFTPCPEGTADRRRVWTVTK